MRQGLKLATLCSILGLMFCIACQKELTCYTCNESPTANAGVDQVFSVPIDSIRLDGSASKDSDGKIDKWLWSTLTAPPSSVIVNPTLPTTAVKVIAAGTYTFELKVTDDQGAIARDTVKVTINNPLINQPPVANAGQDQTITLPTNSIALNGSQTTDPNNNITTYSWSLISGTSTPTIANANAVIAQASQLVQGIYHFQLKVADAGGLLSHDTVKVMVKAVAVVDCDNLNRPVINAMLVPFATLPEPSSGMSVATAGNKIVFAGASLAGNPPNYGSSKVHIYDVSTQTWSTAALSASRADVAAVAAGNKIFFAGGRLGNGGSYNYFSTVDIFDVVTNQWSVANLSQPRAYIAAASVGDKVLFAGGEQQWPLPVSDRVDIYNLSSNSWTTASLTVQRNGLSAVTANNKILFAGGSNQVGGTNNVSNIIDVYDYTTNSWSSSTLSRAKTFFSGINVNNKIYWAGGYDSSGNPSCTVEIKDITTQAISSAHLFHPFTYVNHEGLNAVLKNNKIIWFCTLDPLNGNSTNKFNIYDITTNTWSIGLLPVKINGASIISVNNTIYVAGGSLNGTITNQVWKLEF